MAQRRRVARRRLHLSAEIMGSSVAEAQFEVRLCLCCIIFSRFINFSSFTADPPADGVKRRKKRNRWGDAQENKAAGLMGLPTMIMANFTNEQLEAYTLHLRIEEISQKLRINDVVPADGDRFVFVPLSSSFFFFLFRLELTFSVQIPIAASAVR